MHLLLQGEIALVVSRAVCASPLSLSPSATAGAASADSVPMALSAGQLALQNSKKEKQGYDVFVRNLLEDTKTEDLYAFFEPAGKIIRAPRLNLGRGFAWITFDSMVRCGQSQPLPLGRRSAVP